MTLFFSSSSSRNIIRIPKIIRLIRLTRLLRLLRIFRLSRLYVKWQSQLQINSAVFSFVKLFVLLAVLAHFVACFWFLTAVLHADDNTSTWLHVYGLRDAWVVDQYCTSYYWAVQTIATVGYGDIVANTPAERSFVICAIVVGVGMYSYAVGSMSYLVQRLSTNPTEEKLDAVNRYMQYRRLPKRLQVAVREHYLFAWRRHSAVQRENRILRELSVTLRTDVAMFLKQKILKNVPLFDGTSSAFITDVILRLRPQAAAPKDFIVRAGTG